MLVGYMARLVRIGSADHNLQRDALLAAGVDGRHLFEDHASGARDDRPGLLKALGFVRPGDVLVVWKVDWLGPSRVMKNDFFACCVQFCTIPIGEIGICSTCYIVKNQKCIIPDQV